MPDYSTFSAGEFAFDESFRRCVRGVAPTAEADFWLDYTRQNPARQPVLTQARALVLAVQTHEPDLSDEEIARAIQQTTEQLPFDSAPGSSAGRVRWLGPVWLRVAASVLVLLGLGWGAWKVGLNPSASRPVTYRELVSQAGSALTERHNTSPQPQTFALPDGSRVTLQPASRLSFPNRFAADTRQVYLSGEAFFEVVKNPGQPFLVTANELTTKVLGTSFRVRAFDGAAQTTVEVRTGRVAVSTRTQRADETLVLTPNQRAVFSRADERLTKSLVERPALLPEVAAKPNFAFNDAPVTAVFEALEVAYGVDIVYDEELLRRCLLTISLTDEPLFEKLAIVCKAIEARSETLDGRIVIHSAGCQ